MARKFFYVCAGLFLLALTYHLGARRAGAQVSNTVAAIAWDSPASQLVVVNQFGDVWTQDRVTTPWRFAGPLVYVGNLFAGGPTPVQQETWGKLKARYR